jgi:DNA-directed RNA polymerase specialized sigma24 family protein
MIVENLSASPASIDLRRARRREAIDQIVESSRVLPDAERALVQAVYRDGRTAVELAALMRESPQRVRRRLKSIVKRLANPRLAFVVAASDAWPERRRRIARAVYIEGRSIRQIAREQEVSLYAVRRHVLAIEALFEARTSTPEAWGAGGTRRHAS